MSTRAMEAEVEKAARTSGVDMRLNRGTASLILSGKYKSKPSDSTIRAIAHLAGVPEYRAFEAAQRPQPTNPFRDELPEGVDHLSPKRRRVALEVLRALVEAEELEHRLAAVPEDDVPMSDVYMPDGALNPDKLRFVRTSDARRAGLLEHLQSGEQER
ncbi:hypothetical protein [Nocardia sp. SC052]|uniref:hypothetical protein n=1 Tax=Nocardia sichangensis TaxID=3385975 RepID=UPI0039A2DD78